MVLGIALRLYRLDAQSLWYDEVITYLAARGPVSDYLWTNRYYATAHSLYFAIVHVGLMLGSDEVFLRLPSFVLGTLSIPLLYLVVRPWLGASVALGAAALLAVSPFHVYYSQEARPYAALLCFALVALACLHRARAGGRPLLWVAGAGLGIAAMLYTHPVGVFFLPVLALVPPPRNRAWPSRWWWAAVAGGIVLAAPTLIRIVLHPPARSTNPVEFVGLAATPYLFWTFVAGYSLGPSVRELHGPDRWGVALASAPVVLPVAALAGGLMLAGLARIWRLDRRLVLLLMAWLLVPIAAVTVFAPLTHQPLNARYVILAFPALLVLVAAGTEGLPRRWRIAAWIALLGVSGIALANYHHAGRYQREDYRAAVAALRAEARPGDLVLVTAPYTILMLRYYDPGRVEAVPYPDRGPDEAGIAHRTTTRDWEFWLSELERRIAGRTRFWVLLSRTWRYDPPGRLVPYLDGRFTRAWSGSWAGTRLILYEISAPTDSEPR
jgi:4-amino-4-deoxy-L-arabinose transferase-like glycosyltransferase